jgi:Protein of unknown function (DUF2442)
MATVGPVTAMNIQTTSNELIIVLRDRREIRIPWDKCFPLLAAATDSQRSNAELSPGGYGIHWPDLDEDLTVNGLLQRR